MWTKTSRTLTSVAVLTIVAGCALVDRPPTLTPSGSAGVARGQQAWVVAVIGDYGNCAYNCKFETSVASLVHSWAPDSIWTTGDNSYESATASEISADQQPYLADIRKGIFFPVLGNHDYGQTCHADGAQESIRFFNRPAHYVAHLDGGIVDMFALDLNCGSPDGYKSNSSQAHQYVRDVAASRARWKITVGHQPYYASVANSEIAATRWAILPAIDLFISGSVHGFEHLVVNGHQFAIVGAGGRSLQPMCLAGCQPGSIFHEDRHFGAVRLTFRANDVKVEFISDDSVVLHSFDLTKAPKTSQ